jgi:hypothetical protein
MYVCTQRPKNLRNQTRKKKTKTETETKPKKINQEKNSCRNQTWKQTRAADYNRRKLMKALEGD